MKDGVTEEVAPAIIQRAEKVIDRTGKEFRMVFLNEYKRLMSNRLGLRSQKETDFQVLFSELLDTLEALELDFNHFFRRLSSVSLSDIETKEMREKIASIFFHNEGHGGIGYTEDSARQRVGDWLDKWRQRIIEDWGVDQDMERQKIMKNTNPKVSLSLPVSLLARHNTNGWICLYSFCLEAGSSMKLLSVLNAAETEKYSEG